ncbi:MAG: hypothetical protein J6K87_03445 [Clostridia bacterium]|nr:hypothetical protein [Clostridia bacterium]
MLKVKEILLRFQEDTKFIEKVAKSNTIDKLYEVFCEYEYDSDINSFESEIYELLSNSDLVKESIDEEELERISGGASTRAKIMSVIALSSLAMGGIAPITHVDARTFAAQTRSRKCGDTLLPVKEWEAIGIGLLTTILGLGGGGYIYHRHKKSKSNTQVHMPTPITEFQEHRDQTAGFDSSVFEGGDKNDETYNFDEEGGFEKALECIKLWHKDGQAGTDAFPPEVVKAVDRIEKTFFPNGKPEALQEIHRKPTSLKLFPHTVEHCTQQTDKYFVPLSWNNGEGTFDKEDSFMLHKVLFQYLCRMLCFVLSLDTSSTWSKEQHYVYYLEGKDRFNEKSCAPDYTRLFACMMQTHGVRKDYQRVKSQVQALIKTLDSMYSHAKSMGSELAKCGVFCGNFARSIDN